MLISPCLLASLFAFAPQETTGASAPPMPLGLHGVDVPLGPMPGVPRIANTVGVAFLDYDGDGWIDLFVNANAGLWRNEGGTSFTQVADLDDFLPPIVDRYGASCGDYDNDGLPDIACEPRGDCIYLLENVDGAGTFLEVAADPTIVLDPPGCEVMAETFCWADVDADGDLDLWATAYSDEIAPGSGGNQFFENLGPSGPGGAYRLERRTTVSGLGNPENVSRPEGAQFADLDRDGDLDAYANGTLYQNITGDEGPRFQALVRSPTGITMAARLDEGVTIFDYDLDGDEDIFVLYKGTGNRIWENEGDGTFFLAADAIEMPSSGSTEGCSAEDWDLDGDLDLTTGHIFRRNLLVETGERFLRIASHSIPFEHLTFPNPAWGDWDKDGDMDCMLANWRGRGRFYRNNSYGSETPALEKRSIRVRPVNDSDTVPRGLETQFGATVEIRVQDDPSGHQRRRSVSSSHGYLQQSEYALTFALPAGPDPAAPANDLFFDVLVDFPSLPASGIRRIDRGINPILGDLELAVLAEREITVFRSGRVRIDGVEYEPLGRLSPELASTGSLVLPTPGGPLEEPVPAPHSAWVVGMEIDTLGFDGGIRVEELVLDGQLAPSGPARCDANILLLDVTPQEPATWIALQRGTTSARNDRSFIPLAWRLKPERVYRVLCRVTELRASPRAEPTPGAPLGNRGGLSFANVNPCDESDAQNATLDPATNYIELRYRRIESFPARGR